MTGSTIISTKQCLHGERIGQISSQHNHWTNCQTVSFQQAYRHKMLQFSSPNVTLCSSTSNSQFSAIDGRIQQKSQDVSKFLTGYAHHLGHTVISLFHTQFLKTAVNARLHHSCKPVQQHGTRRAKIPRYAIIAISLRTNGNPAET